MYGNTFGGKTVVPATRTASVGVEVYGNVTGMIFSDNTLTQIYNGISSDLSFPTSTSDQPEPSASYFNLISDNNLNGAVNEISTTSVFYASLSAQNFPGNIGHLGDTYRNNTMTNLTGFGINFAGWCYYGGDLVQNVYEHNSETGATTAVNAALSSNCGANKTFATKITDLSFYKNTFNLGSGTYTGSQALSLSGSTTSLWDSGNTWSGFATGVTDTLQPPTPVVP